jgi:hypothetical protein
MTPGNVRARIAAGGTAVTGTGAAASLALALLVLVCAFVAVAVPRASLGYRTAVLQRSFHAASSSTTTVLADATINGLSGGSLSAAQLASASASYRSAWAARACHWRRPRPPGLAWSPARLRSR